MAETYKAARITRIPYWRLILEQDIVTQEIVDYPLPGTGTENDPFVVTWISNDPRNPMRFSQLKKWTITMLVALAALAVSLDSSAYTGGIAQIEKEFQIGTEVATLGVSLFVLGFAIGIYDIKESAGDTGHELTVHLHRTSSVGTA
ncbi:hypothetical protein VI817_010155 [Penicillium citrinum]|nr:hypothetical protein VI817_010155 [Penicillium citrinum]